MLGSVVFNYLVEKKDARLSVGYDIVERLKLRDEYSSKLHDVKEAIEYRSLDMEKLTSIEKV